MSARPKLVGRCRLCAPLRTTWITPSSPLLFSRPHLLVFPFDLVAHVHSSLADPQGRPLSTHGPSKFSVQTPASNPQSLQLRTLTLTVRDEDNFLRLRQPQLALRVPLRDCDSPQTTVLGLTARSSNYLCLTTQNLKTTTPPKIN
jgi:hypothetical protein